MGNCQVTDTAAVVIQHPNGRIERLYWPTSAGDVMRSHPGLYVTLVSFQPSNAAQPIRFTRVKLLKHKDILLVGQIYRLVTPQEVAKALSARKEEKTRKARAERMSLQKQSASVAEEMDQVGKPEKERHRSSRLWRPSLQSISEA